MTKKKTAVSKKKVLKTAGRKAGGSKLARTEIVQVRLDPKLRFMAELAARKHRRTLSAFIEWCVSEMVMRVEVGIVDSETAFDAMQYVWHSHEANRFRSLAITYPYLMTYEENRLWDLIKEKQPIWDENYSHKISNLNDPKNIEHYDYDSSSPYFRKAYDNLKMFMAGEIKDDLLDGCLEKSRENILSSLERAHEKEEKHKKRGK